MRFDTIQTFDMNHFDKQFFVSIWFSLNSVETHIQLKLACLGEATIELDFYNKVKSGGENV